MAAAIAATLLVGSGCSTDPQGAAASWASVLEEQSGRADDGQLKAVLAEVAAEVDTLKADLNSIDETKIDRLRQRLDQLCGS